MYIKQVRIDRFGNCSELVLDGLSEGLNVFYGPAGSGKTTIARFIRAVLYGFDEPTRERYLPSDSRGFGGSITLGSETGRQTISRYDDGSYAGRLTIEHEDGTLIGRRHVPEAIAGVHLSTWDRIYAVDYRQRPGISMLIEEARQRGFDLTSVHAEGEQLRACERRLQEQRDILATIPRVSTTHEQLQERRSALQQTIRQLETDLAQLPQADDVAPQMAALEQQLADLQEALRPVQRQLAEAQRNLEEAVARHRSSCRVPDAMAPRLKELQQLSQQLGRWQSVRREIGERRKAVREQVEQLAAPHAAARPRRWLSELESLLDDLQSTLARFDDAANYSGKQIKGLLTDVFSEVRSNIYRLCNDLNSWQTRAQRKDLAREARRLRRCESELQETIQGLARRKRAIESEVAQSSDRLQEALPPWHDPWCECAEHPRLRLDVSTEDGAAELAALEAEVVLQRRRHERMAGEANELQAALDKLHSRPQAIDRATWLERLDEQRSELRRVEQDLRHLERRRELLSEINALEAELQTLRGAKEPQRLTAVASEFLRRLSAGEWRKVEVAANEQVWVVDEYGRSRAYHQLPDGARDLTYLAICLALAAAARERGVKIPLLISGAFTHVDARKVPEAAEVLREFAARGHQVVALTRHEHEAAVFRQLGVAVRNLSALAPSPGLGNLAWQRGPLPEPNSKGHGSHPSPSPVPLSTSHEPELQSVKSVFSLTEYSPIEDAPSLGGLDAEQLRQIGVFRVGDLLRLSAAEVAEELSHVGVTVEMMRSWQAQARLLCQVPHLRPYDARVLVACGVTQPDQLRRLSPAELRATIQNLVDSHHGQKVLLSGTEFELSRLTDWISGQPANREAARSPVMAAASAAKNDARGRASSQVAEEYPDVLPLKPLDSTPRFHLHRRDPVVDAPTIGPRIAERLGEIGIKTVGDLLTADAENLAERLNHRRCSAKVVRQWQQQAELACRVPHLRGLQAQILVGVGIRSPEELAACEVADLWPRVRDFVASKEGLRLLREATAPDVTQVANWIKAAQSARQLEAA